MYPVKIKRKKRFPDMFVYLLILIFNSVGIALFGVIFTQNLFFVFAFIGASVATVVMYFMTDAYDIVRIQEQFRDDGNIDLSLFLVQLAEIEYKKFGKYNKAHVQLRIKVLEKDLKAESIPEKKKIILQDLKQLCVVFGYSKKCTYYDERLRLVNKGIVEHKGHKTREKEDKGMEKQLDEIEDHIKEDPEEVFIKEV